MSKRGPMDKFIKSRQLVAEDTSNSEADDGVIETKVLPSKRIRTVFTRKYDSSYIQFGFVATNDGEVPKPLCVICGDVLANHSMKPSHLKRHLNTKHKEMSSKSKEFFARKHVDLKSRQKQIFKVSRTNTCALRASYKIDGQKRKLEAWKSRVSKDCYDMFHLLATVIDDAGEELNIVSLRKVIEEHLINLADRFQHYFPAEEDPRIGNGWIRNPFIPLRDDFVGSVLMEDKLLDLAADEGLKRIFETSTSLASFWIKVKT
ncbi:hypothetical protein GJ496_006406 [Pomphorhynchus laevis]|nr:hypothetical protein GJ496_006406 [Pomphorhynchus laevis]